MIDCGDWVLPQQLLLRNERAEITRDRAHVAMSELEPGARKRVSELIRMLVEAPRDLFVGRVEAQGEVGRQHGRGVTLRRVVRIRHCPSSCAILRSPLMRTGGALGQLPLVAEQVFEEVTAPLRRCPAPGDLDAAGDRVTRDARGMFARPAEALRLDLTGFRLRAH